MIKVSKLNKSFDDFHALIDVDLNIKKGSIYGLIGTNGSGKTTLIKHLIGMMKQTSGTITIEDNPIYENIDIKNRIGYIPDDLSFFANYSIKDCARFYKQTYSDWDNELYLQMLEVFKLPEKRKMSKFSKGMQKQAAFILTMSTKPDYLILDEPIDGLDPIVRKLVWKFIVDDVAEREMTVLISSHNLRELEGICDSIGILKKGKVVIERDLDELKADIHKVQVAFPNDVEKNSLEDLTILHKEERGSVDLLIIRNKKEVVEDIIGKHNPVIFDMLPLTLEEIFIYELGGEDDELKNILF